MASPVVTPSRSRPAGGVDAAGSPVRAALDRTVSMLLQGYAFAPGLRARAGRDAVATRLLGQRAVVVGGREGTRLFYDSERFRRHGAIPRPVRRTLFGEGAVHTLDGAQHQARKRMLLAVVAPGAVATLGDIAARRWDEAARGWPARGRVVLFDEAVEVLGGAALEWAGAPPSANTPERARELATIVDGFGGTARQVTARLARRRAERWAGALVADVRAGRLQPPPASALSVISWHRGPDGRRLDERVAAVELLNVVRPTVAVAWFVAFSALALHTHPGWRERLTGADDAVVTAFVDEVRRLYPFTPVLGARVRAGFDWAGARFSRGRMVVLDVYGTDHDPALWPEPERFDPERFLRATPDPFTFIPQGGGDPATGHRCPGEQVTVAMMATALRLLVGLEYEVPGQDLGFPLSRMPTRPRSGFVLQSVRRPG